MRATCLLLCASLLACRTSDLGSCASATDCSSNAICDGSRRVCVLTDAPQISNVSVTTTPAYAAPDGKMFFDTAGSPLSVSATITSRLGASVDASSACLRITGETGACAHPGAAGASDTFTFALPRLAGPADGTPLGFSVFAASASGHSSSSAVQQIYFDDQAPSISIADDPAAYARTLPDGGVAPIYVSATIADGSGVVSPQLLSGTKTIAPVSATGGVYVFPLDPADAPAGIEGAYSFQIVAQDNLGHSRQVSGSRKIDDAAPDASVKVFSGSVEPPAAGVTYPALLANTGWTGNSFIYSDVVHVKGTITDLSGVGSATLHIDGIELDGGVSAGMARALGCSAGTTSCAFDVTVALNDPQNGVFHTGTGDAGLPDAGAAIPSGFLHLVVDAQDNAVAYGGTAAARTVRVDTPARATRLLWSTVLALNTTSSIAVTGLAVHANGSIVATTDGGASTVFGLSPADGSVEWSTNAGTVLGPPAIGSGGAADAAIYTASLAGGIFGLAPDGGLLWSATGDNFSVGPAVGQAVVGGATVDQVLLPDNVAGTFTLWSVTAPGNVAAVTSVASVNRDRHASPMVFDGGVWFGTATSVDWHSLPGDGGVGASVVVSSTVGPTYYGPITDGANVFAATRATTPFEFHAITPLLANLWTKTMATGLPAGLSAEPTLGIDGQLYGSDDGFAVRTYDPATGNTPATALVTLAATGQSPLHGSDAHWYLPRTTGLLLVFQGGQTSWLFDPPGTILRGAAMDCQGRLFVGTGGTTNGAATVWAFVTDDHGLADTPWPSWRRDARNTGNAGAVKYGIRTASGCTQ
jgi:hypothetical protein